MPFHKTSSDNKNVTLVALRPLKLQDLFNLGNGYFMCSGDRRRSLTGISMFPPSELRIPSASDIFSDAGKDHTYPVDQYTTANDAASIAYICIFKISMGDFISSILT